MTRFIIPAFAACALVACGKNATTGSTPETQPRLVSSNSNPVPTAAVAIPTAGKFEGEIVLDVKKGATNVPASVTFDIKGDKVRYEPASAPVRAVDDLTAQHAYVISDTKKAYSDIDGKPAASTSRPQVKVERSAKEEKVAGLGCEDWTIDDGNERADVCAAKGIAFFDPASDAKPGNTEPSWARAMTTEKAFPLRVVVHDKNGKEEYRAEAFEVNWKKVDDTAFQVPAGFRKSDLTSDLKTASLP